MLKSYNTVWLMIILNKNYPIFKKKSIIHGPKKQ